MSYQSIKNWPEEERPRERLLKLGADKLSNAQLLAIILRTGGGGRSAIDLAMEMLASFKKLKDIDSASAKEFASLKGIGSAKVAQIKAAFELGRRLFRETDEKGPAFSSSHDVYSYYHPLLNYLKKEVLFCAMLDAKNRIFRELQNLRRNAYKLSHAPARGIQECYKGISRICDICSQSPKRRPDAEP